MLNTLLILLLLINREIRKNIIESNSSKFSMKFLRIFKNFLMKSKVSEYLKLDRKFRKFRSSLDSIVFAESP
eukprot:Pgem_evm1s1439